MASDVCLVSYFAWPVLAGISVDGISPGGEEVQHTLLAKALARNGVKVALVCGDFGQPNEINMHGVRVLKTFKISDGLPVIRMIHPRLSALWAALRKADADTYYVSCAGAIVGYVAAFCKIHSRRFVFRIASDADCCPERLLVSNARDRWLYDYGIQRANRVLAQTEHQQALLRKNYGIDTDVLGMLVDIPDIIATDTEKDIDVLWLANLRSVKRPEWVVEIARALPNVRFTMAGGPYTGQRELYESVRESAQSVNNLEFLGGIPHETTAELFRRTRIFLNTSELEGFPNTYLQAWANGVPVVATFDPDGLIARESFGISCVSQEQLCRAIENLLRDANLRNKASSAARKFMEQKFGTVVINRYLTQLAGGTE